MGTEILHFYTNGPEFTNLIRNFIYEGNYLTAYDILNEGGMPDKFIRQFFLMGIEFEGTTKNGNSLNVITLTSLPDNSKLGELFYTGIKTALSNGGRNSYDIKDINSLPKGKVKKNIDTLFNVVGKDYILNLITPLILKQHGFSIVKNVLSDDEIINGAITMDGTFISCGVQEHQYLYPVLYTLNLSDSSDWTNDTMTIHVSDNQISGNIVSDIKYQSLRGNETSKELIDTLFKWRNVLHVYGENGKDSNITNLLNHYIAEKENHGGKYNNLMFLKHFYPEINIPKISKTILDDVEKQCIRTSPKYSLPGLLESKFEINENSIKEIKMTFDKYKNVIKDNGLHFFYQEFINGDNGVCNYIDKIFDYKISSVQGDIVKGKTSNDKLKPKLVQELKKIAKSIGDDLDQSIQLEFVVNDEKIYIVQLRILKNNYENTVIIHMPKDVIVTGKTFSKGTIKVDVNDILVVQSDSDSKDLLGKKALIVKDDVQFSHALALSKALLIPSMYATGDFELPKSGKVNFVAYNKESWITF